MRLWQIDTLIAKLGAERVGVLERLQQPEGSPAALPGSPSSPSSLSSTREQPSSGAGHGPRQFSAQQVLLGLGTLLLLSAVAFFLVVAWFRVGVVGQAGIVVALIVAASLSSRAAARRELTATAVSFGVLASGLVWLGAGGAHHLNLVGLGEVDLAWFWAGAHLVIAVLLWGLDRLVPTIQVYRLGAALAATSVPWCAAIGLDASGTAFIAALGAVAVVDLALAVAISRTPWRSHPAQIALAGAAAAAVAFEFGACGIALDLTRTSAERAVAGLLLTAPVIGVLLALGSPATWVSATVRRWLPIAVAVTAMPVLLAFVLDLPQPAIVAVSVPAALASVRAWEPSPGWIRSGPRAHARWDAWRPAACIVASFLTAASWVIGSTLVANDVRSLHGAVDGFGAPAPMPVLLGMIPALALVAASAFASSRYWPRPWAQAHLIAALGAGVWSVSAGLNRLAPIPHLLILCAATIVTVGAAAWIAAAAHRSAGDQRRLLNQAELALALGSGVLGSITMAYSVTLTVPGWLPSAVIWAICVAVFIYAAVPRRFFVAYVGAALAGVAWLMLLDSLAGSPAVEVFTLPCAALLALIGWLQVRVSRGVGVPTVPTVLSAGPALALALGPSAALGEGNLRLAAVGCVAVLLLAVGYVRSWQAPILVGGAVLVWIALTQGGPHLAHVPTWVTLGVAGTALLSAGVMWERAVKAGRRSAAWLADLA